MSKRYNVCSPRPRKDKTHWHPVGSAFEDEKGVTIYLDSAPYPDAEGRVVLKLFEPRDRDDNPRGRSAAADRQQAQSRSLGADDDFDPSVPF